MPASPPGWRASQRRLERADAQVHRFPPKRFDLAISRFGTMFFDDPVAAFASIGRALRPAGRLVMMVWQGHERNERDVAIHGSSKSSGLGGGRSRGPDPFSLAAERALTRLRETLAAHAGGDGIWFDLAGPDRHRPPSLNPPRPGHRP